MPIGCALSPKGNKRGAYLQARAAARRVGSRPADCRYGRLRDALEAGHQVVGKLFPVWKQQHLSAEILLEENPPQKARSCAARPLRRACSTSATMRLGELLMLRAQLQKDLEEHAGRVSSNAVREVGDADPPSYDPVEALRGETFPCPIPVPRPACPIVG